MPVLSVLIAARNERFLSQTIRDVLTHGEADTEVICVLDGSWADPGIEDHPRVRLIYRPSSIGQRAAVNVAARVSRSRYVMKLDAHCSVAQGFDAALIAADEDMGNPALTQIPAMYNLHAFNRQCPSCRWECYQGPSRGTCEHCQRDVTFTEVMVWERRQRKPRANGQEPSGQFTLTEFWRFNHQMHFQYKGPRAIGELGDVDLADVMSSVGACFFMRRDRFLVLGGVDEAHGSWGNFGTEIACKSWLSGGRQIVNRRTWFAHLFRTQGHGFGFPYAMSPDAQDYARRYSQQLWWSNHWEGQHRPLSWMLDHFYPVPGWHLPGRSRDERQFEQDHPGAREARLAFVAERGEEYRQGVRVA